MTIFPDNGGGQADKVLRFILPGHDFKTSCGHVTTYFNSLGVVFLKTILTTIKFDIIGITVILFKHEI
jgi:hypothetical protein